MITVISGTNRRNSRTLPVTKQYFELFKKHAADKVRLFTLDNLPLDFIHNGMYNEDGQNKRISEIQDEYILPADKLFFVFPEYNGSYPGVLKLFIDACSIRKYKQSFSGKRAGLAGVATGRAGNLRGMDHFADILNHVGTIVMPNKFPLSVVDQLINEEGYITDEATLKAMEAQVKQFIQF